MLELVKLVVEKFADKKDAILYDVNDDGRNVNITVTLDSSDMGKVIGTCGGTGEGNAVPRRVVA